MWPVTSCNSFSLGRLGRARGFVTLHRVIYWLTRGVLQRPLEGHIARAGRTYCTRKILPPPLLTSEKKQFQLYNSRVANRRRRGTSSKNIIFKRDKMRSQGPTRDRIETFILMKQHFVWNSNCLLIKLVTSH